MDFNKMEEFRSNLLLLLQCGHPEGLAINQLKSEYKQYFLEDVGPETILPRGYKNSKHWDSLFTLKEFKEDFTLFYTGPVVYVKAVRKRSHSEMKLIAQLAKHSHMFMAKKAEFQCGCCKPEFWKNMAKEAAIEPTSTATNSQELTQCQPEDIVVKIEPRNMMNNGDDSSSTGDGMGIGGSGQEALYSLEQQGNPQRSSFVNGNAVLNLNHDPTSGTNASNTNDGFMLDHQLRVQQNANNQNISMQAFASLLNSQAGAGGQSTNSDGGSGQGVSQPFFTFLLQNGELKVMQVVSTVPENGDTTTSTSASAGSSTNQSSIPQMNLSDLISPSPVKLKFICSMAGCGATFDEKQLLQNHERTCSLKKYPCTFPDCDRRFKNSKQRHAHHTSRHRGTENAFHCTVPDCAAFFKTADRLKVHESRCRFKYEQFQLMDVEEMEILAMNNNNNSNFMIPAQSSVPNSTNSSTHQSIETQSGTNAAFNTATILPVASPMNSVPVVINIPDEGGSCKRSKVDNSKPDPTRGTPDLQGFSTIDLSLVKSEVLE